ncbi:hypothetical protein FXF51_02340 [Nonomuraea sp. PA05]|uniref:hypothetical protein n=1 Tax=Nonomuraea sp. PA05 TaxID=2604466 RepID=UPI0011D60397|nr:hypothetical protein [Nonomuraea sp. PA05]TYB71293.1 hypothetical protein FXF51_02340 [Nonomuraea sp. PA05]
MSDIPSAIEELRADVAKPYNAKHTSYVELVGSAADLLQAIHDTRSGCSERVVVAAERFAAATLLED